MKQADRGSIIALLVITGCLAAVCLPYLSSPKSAMTFGGLVAALLMLFVALNYQNLSSLKAPEAEPTDLAPLEAQILERKRIIRRANQATLLVCAAVIAAWGGQKLFEQHSGFEDQWKFNLGFLMSLTGWVAGLIFVGVALANFGQAIWLSWGIRQLRRRLP